MKQQPVIRTGCLACRARGARCDSKDSRCSLYSSTAWNSNQSTSRRKTEWPASGTSYGHSLYSITNAWKGTHRERHSLNFFCVISATELSGFLDRKLWHIVLPRATRHDNAIKHAVAAIGASHEHQLRKQATRENAETDELSSFALRQCNKAIADLLRPTKDRSLDLTRTLTACMLFAIYESLNGHREGALPHVIYSRRILEQLKSIQSDKEHCTYYSTYPVDVQLLEPLVSHFSIQTGHYIYEEDEDNSRTAFDFNAPLDFKTLVDARTTLEEAMANLGVLVIQLEDHSLTRGKIDAVIKAKGEFTTWLQCWEQHFDTFLTREGGTLDRETLDGCRLLKAHHLAVSALAEVEILKGEAAWERFSPNFRAIVELIREINLNLPKPGIASQVP